MKKGWLAGLVLSTLATTALAKDIDYSKILRDGETKFIRVTGISMYPTLPLDGWVQMKRIPYNELKPGMIVVYFNIFYNKIIDHKIMHKGGIFAKGWVTKGDHYSCKVDPGLVTPENYIGIVQIN